MGEDIQNMAKELFTTDPEEMLREQLPRMQGWFDVTDGNIAINVEQDRLNQDEQYLLYLCGALVAAIAGTREDRWVSHAQANDYFDWSNNDGRSAKHYASKHANLIETDDGKKAVAKHKLKDVVDLLAEKCGDDYE